jgi:tRNA threonylcarbamoyladenosine biosynthesis protein TsaE
MNADVRPTQPLTLLSDSVEQTLAIGRAVAGRCRAGDAIALIGPLGAGKTQFVRGLVEGLGGQRQAVSSPTFVLMQEYQADPPVLHLDAYRLQNIDEVQTLGWSPELAAESISVIEWADRLDDQLPTERLEIAMAHVSDHQRELRLSGTGNWQQRLADMARAVGKAWSEPAGVEPLCPICGAAADPNAAAYPFCTDRCKMVDLGRWFGGGYRIARDIDWINDDLTDLPTEADEP